MSGTISPTKLPALTGLRYVAALTVLLAHTGQVLPPNCKTYTSLVTHLAFIGMPLFFVLSRCVMTHNYLESFRTDGWRGVRPFYVARIARIYPLYLIILIFSFTYIGSPFHDLIERPRDSLKSLAYVTTLTQ